MIKKFLFDGNTYLSERDVRQAVFAKDRKVFGEVPSENIADFWAKHGVSYVEEQEPIEALKNLKTQSIKKTFLNWRNNKATLVSSLGFKIDSNERANSDIGGLLIAYENNQNALITFRDANNEFHSLTYAQLKVLQLEIIENGNHAYAQKWAFDAKVESATTKEELDAIEVKFVGKDFAKEL